jgi:hypothetical protein
MTRDWKKLTVTFDGYLNGSLSLPVVVGVALGDVITGNPITGSVVISADYSATMVVDVSSGFDLTIDGDFSFDGDTRRWTLPHIHMDVKFDKLADIPLKLLEEIGKDAEHIFEDAVVTAGRLIVKYLDKTWDEIENVAEEVGNDIKHAVERFFGIHSKKRPAVPWLRNGALISAGGATITSDPTDPNYTPQAVYVVRNLQRVHVPDMATLASIDPKGAPDYPDMFRDGANGFLANYVITIPVAPFEYPSVQDGTFFWEYDVKQPKSTLYLVLSTMRGKNDSWTPGHYRIASNKAVWPDLNTYMTTANPPGSRFQRLPCNPGDTPGLGDSPLSAVCQIVNIDTNDKAIFFDGSSRSLPDALLPFLDTRQLGGAISLTANGFSGIPQGNALTPIANDQLLKGQSDPTVYYVTGNRLCAIPSADDFNQWGFNWGAIVPLDDAYMSVLAKGDKLKKKP